ncbi:uncharacterized protein BDCG_16856 [Blastomyces dermatitidis ER-3]|uniref:Uncharacterized protein n=1 Tax=Ajellomyces dermatitidis (strain ER-3 / ATCC MYA-2586) TaxID=559297 RepID=A0ABX2VW78_AJEDR|nr:uncharacterized protein BDCG_16856 [Blastomyces dermatitidis ER-3]OAT01023.1 hypothetical protein BDCG_16856 [Blastomyces dermatitidis ER-3]
MSDTPVTSEFSSRLRITHFTRQLIDRMITHYEKASDLQDKAEISFHQSMEFDDKTTEELQNKEKQSQSQHSSAESMTAAEITQHLTTSAQRDITRNELWKYQKEVKYALNIKSVTTFNDSNYEAWHVDMLTDAEVIDETDILLRT